MELNGDIFIDAARERVWQALNDPQVLLASGASLESKSAGGCTPLHLASQGNSPECFQVRTYALVCLADCTHVRRCCKTCVTHCAGSS